MIIKCNEKLTHIIAEIGVNYNGNVQLAKEMIAQCKNVELML